MNKKLGKANLAIEEVEFEYSSGQLRITVVGSENILPANGASAWSTSIPLQRYQALTKLPPIADPLVIEYDSENSRLKIGTTVFKSYSSAEI